MQPWINKKDQGKTTMKLMLQRAARGG